MTKDLHLDPNISKEKMISLAEGGHPTAQYNMAKMKEFESEEKESLDWLRKSADANFIPARFELGMWHLLGHIVEHDHSKAADLIQQSADAGYSNALRLLATLHGMGFAFEKSWEKLVDLLIKAADMEDPYAMRQIGFLLRQSKHLKALGKQLLTRSASLSEYVACQLLGKKQGTVTAEEIPAGWDQWPVIREFLLALDKTNDFAAKEISSDPHILKFEKALSSEECLYLRESARPSLTADVQLLGGNPDDPSYTQLQNNRVMVMFPIVQDIVTILLSRRLAHLAEAEPEFAELLVIQNYTTGQEFKPHTDYMDPEAPQHAFSIQQSGQRIKSVFAYLNDNYQGGETAFTRTALKFKGSEGDVLVLDNMGEIGLPNENSEHASLPVTTGEKWLATLWIRDKNQINR